MIWGREFGFLIQITEPHDLSPIKFVWDELDIEVQRECSNSESEIFSAWKMIGKKKVFVKQYLNQVVVLLTKAKYDAFV